MYNLNSRGAGRYLSIDAWTCASVLQEMDQQNVNTIPHPLRASYTFPYKHSLLNVSTTMAPIYINTSVPNLGSSNPKFGNIATQSTDSTHRLQVPNVVSTVSAGCRLFPLGSTIICKPIREELEPAEQRLRVPDPQDSNDEWCQHYLPPWLWQWRWDRTSFLTHREITRSP
jgi:hypothetical protein